MISGRGGRVKRLTDESVDGQIVERLRQECSSRGIPDAGAD